MDATHHSLTLEQKIGQLLFFGFDGYAINDHVREAIHSWHIGNVILFTRNFKDSRQLYQLVQDLQREALQANGVPLFIAVDQEGGSVARFIRDFTWFPGHMAIRASREDPNLAYDMGMRIGEEIARFGIHINLAPVVNLCSMPNSPHTGSRSFGASAQEAIPFASAYARGVQRNAIATAKHFPGIGNSDVDLHLELGRNTRTEEHLRRCEMAPAIALAHDGVQNIMIAHEIFPALDAKPATLSRKIVTGILREETGYQNLIISDCMEMKALQDYCGTANGCIGAIQAGIDMLLVCHTPQLQQESAAALFNAVQDGRIPVQRIEDAVGRILRMKMEYHPETILENPYDEAGIAKLFKENRRFAQEWTDKALTEWGDPSFFSLKQEDQALVFSPLPGGASQMDEKTASYSIDHALREQLPFVKSVVIPLDPPRQERSRYLSEIPQGCKKIILCSCNLYAFENQRLFLEELYDTGIAAGTAILRSPYDLHWCSRSAAALAVYEYTPPTVLTLMKRLRGEIQGQGHCPFPIQNEILKG